MPLSGVPPTGTVIGPSTVLTVAVYPIGETRIPFSGTSMVVGKLPMLKPNGSVDSPFRKPFAMTAGASISAPTALSPSPVCTALPNAVALLPKASSVSIGAPTASSASATGKPKVLARDTVTDGGGGNIEMLTDNAAVMDVSIRVSIRLVKFCDIWAGI